MLITMPEVFYITVQDGRTCEARRGETILSALARAGIILSAPCGGRGICGKCHVILHKGKVRLAAADIQPGDVFSACSGIALSDLTLEVPEENAGLNGEQKHKKQNRKKVHRAGAGIDIGTTTVQMELVDLDTGETLETLSELNAQRIYGADVMSRINAARNGKTTELFAAINRQIESMLQNCINAWSLSGIEQCTVSGNTTMLHLFSGIDPSAMGEVPFTPVFLEAKRFSGRELNLSAENILLLPGISAFVGADIVSGLAFLDTLSKEENSLLVDIGTNGEMALWRKKDQRFLCCSTAAGPCFEGAEISCGMGALPGAINRISLKEKSLPASFSYGPLSFTTLDNVPPKGICGAALIDAIAAIKNLDAIDETGALSDEFAETGFPLTEGIFLSQKDIRQFQLAKSAIFSGITVLCKRAGFDSLSDLETVYIAGGLGFFINLENAVTAGLLPKEFAGNRTAVCGNTSLHGAVKSLLDPTFLPHCREIVSRCDTADLASVPDFTEAFADNMYF
jgi:uncharacterized 2Fe-2S/4Fe-4S cluster protein (DUF4445 family)